MFVEIPPHIPVSDFVHRVKGALLAQDTATSLNISVNASARAAISWATSGNITDDVILNYLDKYTKPNNTGFSPKPMNLPASDG